MKLTNIAGTIKWDRLIAVLVVWFGLYAIWGLYHYGPTAIFYALVSPVSLEHVHVTGKPGDCEWGYSPLGDKGCHYEKQILALDSTGALVETTSKTAKDIYIGWDRVQN